MPSSTSSVAALAPVPTVMPGVTVLVFLSVSLTPSSVASGALPVLRSTSSVPSAPIIIVPVPPPLIAVPSSSSSVAALAPVPTVMPGVTVLVLSSATSTPSSVAPGPLVPFSTSSVPKLPIVIVPVPPPLITVPSSSSSVAALAPVPTVMPGVPVLVFLSVSLTPSSVAPGPLVPFSTSSVPVGADRHRAGARR